MVATVAELPLPVSPSLLSSFFSWLLPSSPSRLLRFPYPFSSSTYLFLRNIIYRASGFIFCMIHTAHLAEVAFAFSGLDSIAFNCILLSSVPSFALSSLLPLLCHYHNISHVLWRPPVKMLFKLTGGSYQQDH